MLKRAGGPGLTQVHSAGTPASGVGYILGPRNLLHCTELYCLNPVFSEYSASSPATSKLSFNY